LADGARPPRPSAGRWHDPYKQAAFIRQYETLLNNSGDDQPLPQGYGRQRLNIHGAIDLEFGKTRMIEAAGRKLRIALAGR
jgi:hypothetical protein